MPVRALLIALLVGVLIASASPSAAAAGTNQLADPSAVFDTDCAANAHCPRRDAVVWLSIQTGIYHEKRIRWCGRTKLGAHGHKKEANAAGDYGTRNGK